MATKARKPRPPRVRQGHLPEMEPPSIAEIDDAAEAYASARNDRMSMLETEMELQGKLLALMIENKLKTYEYDGKIVNVTDLQKVAVRKKKSEKEGEE